MDELAVAIVLVVLYHSLVVVARVVDYATVAVQLVVNEQALLDGSFELSFDGNDTADSLLLVGILLELAHDHCVFSGQLTEFEVTIRKVNVDA